MIEFSKYKKIKPIGYEENEGIFDNPKDIIYIQEKVDGANFRFYINEKGILVFGSRSQQLTSNEGEDINIQKNFMRCVNYVRETLKDKDLSEYKGLIFYGECMIKHTIGYDWEKTPIFLGFDILKEDKFLECDEVTKIYTSLGLDVVPLIKVVYAEEIKEKITDKDVPKSKYYSGQAEGIVLKNYEKQLFAKYVRQKFKEKNVQEFGGSKKHTKTDEDYFTAVYCTNARIEKCIWKLMDEDKKLELSLMPHLIKTVYKDVWEEHWNEIVNTKQKTINFDKLKKAFSKRCFHVLNNVITNNKLTT